jgi:hypothetical protein
MGEPKKRGRKSVTEYYKTKKIDKVEIEDIITICIPLSIEEYNHNYNIKRQEEIMLSSPSVLKPYVPENEKYSEIVEEKINKIVKVEKIPTHSETLTSREGKTIIETFDLSLIKNKKEITNSKSNIACWWCCHTFDNPCINLPTNLKRDVYTVYGIFCSYSCCYSYMKSVPEYSRKMHLLNYYFKDNTCSKGSILDHIKPAPPRETLELFGGPLTISEFRSNSSVILVSRYPSTYRNTEMKKTSKIQEIIQPVSKILPPNKKYTSSKVAIPNNSLGKILGITRNI